MTSAERPFDLKAYEQAFSAAAAKIIPNRRRMSLEDAEDIMRLELERRGVGVHLDGKHIARTLWRGPLWSLRHPLQARREGYRFTLSRR